MNVNSPKPKGLDSFFDSQKIKIPEKIFRFYQCFFKKKNDDTTRANQAQQTGYQAGKYGKQLSYRLIYSMQLVELETLKMYIKTHLKTGFIQPFKSPAGELIPFDKKSDGSFCLCVNY